MSMNIRGRKIIGMSDIRTIADRSSDLSESYKVYLRIASLEMEMSRRVDERNTCQMRVKLLNKRIDELEAEKRRLLESISVRDLALAELRPSYEERMAIQQEANAQAAIEQRRLDEERNKQEMEEAEKALQEQDQETRERRRLREQYAGSGFKLRY